VFFEQPKVITLILFFFTDLVLISILNWTAKLRYLLLEAKGLGIFVIVVPAFLPIFFVIPSAVEGQKRISMQSGLDSKVFTQKNHSQTANGLNMLF
jgi:hypothetical protein